MSFLLGRPSKNIFYNDNKTLFNWCEVRINEKANKYNGLLRAFVKLLIKSLGCKSTDGLHLHGLFPRRKFTTLPLQKCKAALNNGKYEPHFLSKSFNTFSLTVGTSTFFMFGPLIPLVVFIDTSIEVNIYKVVDDVVGSRITWATPFSK